MLTPDFGKSNIILIMKQSAICESRCSTTIADEAESLLVWNSHVRANEAKTCLELTCKYVKPRGKEMKANVIVSNLASYSILQSRQVKWK